MYNAYGEIRAWVLSLFCFCAGFVFCNDAVMISLLDVQFKVNANSFCGTLLAVWPLYNHVKKEEAGPFQKIHPYKKEYMKR